jgi:PhoH-like ATPase
MVKKYVLDTNVLLHDPDSIFNFEKNEVYLPIEVIMELDKFKKGRDEINFNARAVTRQIEKLTGDGIPEGGIDLKNGGKLHFLTPSSSLEEKIMGTGYADDSILERTKQLSQNGEDAILVSMDLNIRIRAKIAGLKAEEYTHEKSSIDLRTFFEGQVTHKAGTQLINALYKSDGIPAPDDLAEKLENNQYFILQNGESQSCLVQYRNGKLIPIKEMEIEGIKPRNSSQRFLLHACLDPKITIVSGLGKAGTGKTLLTLAAGLYQVRKDLYSKVLVFRPTREVGESLGFLPGDIHDKIGPYFRAIDTAIDVIYGANAVRDTRVGERIEKMPINFARGDTYHRSFIIVDEAQNLTAREIKLLGTRVGDGSKIVMTGDPFQVDQPYLDEMSNGLTVSTHRLRHEVPEFAYVILDKGERSRVAELFADYL